MTYVKYFWGFDATAEGWTGTNLVWEDGGYGGLPTPHIYARITGITGSYQITRTLTFSSPRNLNIKAGDVILFVFTWAGGGEYVEWTRLDYIDVQVVDNTGAVLQSTRVPQFNAPGNTPSICAVISEVNGAGINIKITITVRTSATSNRHHYYARVDSVTIYENPDQVIHVPLPSTLQASVTHEVPINKAISGLAGAIRVASTQNLASYDEKLTYDTSSEKDYSRGTTALFNVTSSVDKIIVTHTSDTTLQIYYECDHVIWIINQDTYLPVWLILVKFYHNQNLTDPDTVSFSATLDGTNPYTETKTMNLKFKAEELFNLELTPSREVVSGDLSELTQLDATITVKDSGGNTIGTCNYDVLNDSYDSPISIDKTYDNQNLTIEITITANGLPSATISVKLKLNFEFSY